MLEFLKRLFRRNGTRAPIVVSAGAGARFNPMRRLAEAISSHSADASLAAELLKMVFTELGPGDRAQLLAALAAGIEAFTGSDLGTWAAIVDAERVPGGRAMLADVAATPPRRVVQDCSAIRRLCTELGVADELPVTW